MLIVVEGPDGAGKTTLIEQLRKNSTRYFVILRSAGYPTDDAAYARFVDGTTALKEALYPDHVVCDRFQTISEPIYRRMIRGAVLEPDYQADLTEVDIVVYCRPPVETILQNSKVNVQMKGVTETMVQLVEAYDEAIAHIEEYVEIVRYDYQVQSADQLARYLFGVKA